jgi:hypothetical protein
VHPIPEEHRGHGGGSLRVFRQFVWLEVGFRQSGVVSSRPPAGNASRWAAEVEGPQTWKLRKSWSAEYESSLPSDQNRFLLETMNAVYLDDYQNCVEKCATTDYGNPQSVKIHNQAVQKMYEIVEQAARQGEETINTLATLLDHPRAAKWLAFQLLEKANVDSNVENKCLSIINGMANTESADSYGARIWLEKWKQNRNRA